MIDTSLIVDAALRKSQMLLDSLLSLDLLSEEDDFEIHPPRVAHELNEFDEVDAEMPSVHEQPAHACKQPTVQVPVETLQALTDVFEQIKAWQDGSEQADPLATSALGQPSISKHDIEEAGDSEPRLMISIENSSCWSLRSSDSSLDSAGSPGLSTESQILSPLLVHRTEGITVVKSRTWAPAAGAGLLLSVPTRKVPVPAAPVSPRGSLRKAHAVVHQLQNVSSARCTAWHPVAVTTPLHALTVC